MTPTDLEADEQLLARLARFAGAVDPVPAEVVAAASGSYAWRTVGAELAELVYDSDDERELVGVRSDGDARQLTFQGAGLTLEVEVAPGGSLVGQLVPPQPAAIEVRHGSTSTTLRADHLGRFAGAGMPAGPLSVWCRPQSGGTAIATDWLLA